MTRTPRGLVAATLLAALVAACGDKEAGTTDAAVTDSTTVVTPDGRPGADTPDPPIRFPNGVMTAAVRTDRATVWTRTDTATSVRVRYSEEDGGSSLTTDPVEVTQATGFAAQVALDGLKPGTGYSYEVVAEDGTATPTARFETAPDTDVAFRMAFSGDIDNDSSWYRLFDELEGTGAALYVSLGDWPYCCSDPQGGSVS